VPEGNMNAEIADPLREHGHDGDHQGQEGPSRFHIELVEIIEAILLAIVVLSTALSGYQAAKWDGVSAGGYATSSRLRVQSEQASLTSNQQLIYGNLTAWLQAETSGDTRLAAILARRFTPGYAVAFRFWLFTDPLTNPKAPVGPRYMPQYRDPLAAQATALGNQATQAYTAAANARENADEYVRLTVILAAALFLVAIGQRFRLKGVRVAVISIAGMLLLYCAILLVIYPRA
jgi:opacity protein-like surface antigen